MQWQRSITIWKNVLLNNKLGMHLEQNSKTLISYTIIRLFSEIYINVNNRTTWLTTQLQWGKYIGLNIHVCPKSGCVRYWLPFYRIVDLSKRDQFQQMLVTFETKRNDKWFKLCSNTFRCVDNQFSDNFAFAEPTCT